MTAATMHAQRGNAFRWDRMGTLPRKGWSLADVEDRETPDHECEACGYPSVRYVHTLAHPESGAVLCVGCVCSENLTGDYVTPREKEREARNRTGRLARLLDLSRWKPTKAGNRRIEYRGRRIVLYTAANAQGWRVNVGKILGARNHPTPQVAIKAAFNFIESQPGATA